MAWQTMLLDKLGFGVCCSVDWTREEVEKANRKAEQAVQMAEKMAEKFEQQAREFEKQRREFEKQQATPHPLQPPGLGDAQTKTLNAGADPFVPSCFANTCSWAPMPGGLAPRQSRKQRMLGERKDQAPKLCDWCKENPAVSRRRCQRCQDVKCPVVKCQLGTPDAKQTQCSENARKKGLPGAVRRAEQWRCEKQNSGGVQRAGG